MSMYSESRIHTGPKSEHPITQWIATSLEEVSAHVDRWCRRYLSGFNHSDVSPEDARQNVLAKILSLKFAERFDPDKGTSLQFIHGVTRHECMRLIARHYRQAKRKKDLTVDIVCPAQGPSNAAQFAEFVEALNLAKPMLTDIESAALPGVLDPGSRPANPGRGRSTRHVRAFRCRRRLSRSLARFRPG